MKTKVKVTRIMMIRLEAMTMEDRKMTKTKVVFKMKVELILVTIQKSVEIQDKRVILTRNLSRRTRKRRRKETRRRRKTKKKAMVALLPLVRKKIKESLWNLDSAVLLDRALQQEQGLSEEFQKLP
jgi:hypothetical protein